MFERYSDSGRRVVVLAADAARALKHTYVGTEHLLAGLLDTGGRAAAALVHFGFTQDGVQEATVAEIGKGSTEPRGHLPFTPRAKAALMLALQEADELHDEPIDDTHLLLGLLGMESGIGLKIILSKVENVSIIRETILKDMTITRALVSSEKRAITAGVALHDLLEKFIAAGGQVEAVDFERGQADAARQIVEMLRDGLGGDFALAG